ncbi:uncharacterized protein KY384_004015 [Bacidia gigantensis]|uniref:uncharacterized protein n=1 Tax=Bacidia gigantensis TaxID=2732470 RepID=UPI001D04E5A1|nr:uncharacterized protein KY384_004015 [Bacidia gigantensis]KAG8530660.1 hypothetical protein KY384_004015 [Bacidia gigantensis]
MLLPYLLVAARVCSALSLPPGPVVLASADYIPVQGPNISQAFNGTETTNADVPSTPDFPPGPEPPFPGKIFQYAIPNSYPLTTVQFRNWRSFSNRDEGKALQVIQDALTEATRNSRDNLYMDYARWQKSPFVIYVEPNENTTSRTTPTFEVGLRWRIWRNALLGIQKFRQAYPSVAVAYDVMADIGGFDEPPNVGAGALWLTPSDTTVASQNDIIVLRSIDNQTASDEQSLALNARPDFPPGDEPPEDVDSFAYVLPGSNPLLIMKFEDWDEVPARQQYDVDLLLSHALDIARGKHQDEFMTGPYYDSWRSNYVEVQIEPRKPSYLPPPTMIGMTWGDLVGVIEALQKFVTVYDGWDTAFELYVRAPGYPRNLAKIGSGSLDFGDLGANGSSVQVS